ncbi:MAG: NADH-quinone oxidoreductase subunit J [Bacteroidota bacterium]
MTAAVLFCLFAFLSVAGAFVLLLTKKVAYAAYGLLLSLLSVAAVFLLCGAELAAVAQIMVYAGGVVVLLVFGIMLIGSKKSDSEDGGTYNRVGGTFLAVILLAAMIYGVFSADFTKNSKLGLEYAPQTVAYTSPLRQLGIELMSTHLLPFEGAGVLLLAALLVAATVAAEKNKQE